MSETTDAAQLAADLDAALALMARDAMAAALAAGTLPGPEGLALTPHLRQFASDELRDLERVAARITTLGGSTRVTVETVEQSGDWRGTIQQLVEMQREALDALVEAIPADADDPEGEATEHLLEHIVARKRDAIEILERAIR